MAGSGLRIFRREDVRKVQQAYMWYTISGTQFPKPLGLGASKDLQWLNLGNSGGTCCATWHIETNIFCCCNPPNKYCHFLWKISIGGIPDIRAVAPIKSPPYCFILQQYNSGTVAHAGTFKEAEGVGLGDGDTANAKDVSAQIENEDQILGAHQEEKKEEEGSREEGEGGVQDKGKEDEEGVEMEQDFDGELADVSEDEAGNDDDKVLCHV
jgi:hypothetical protein